MDSLASLSLGGIGSPATLERVLELGVIGQLHDLALSGSEYGDKDFPYATLAASASRWRHIRRIYFDGHCVHGETRALFKDYPQVIFGTYDRREFMGHDLATWGHANNIF